MKNSVADRSNAQVSCAGQFIANHIEQFVAGPAAGGGRWLHIDMASPAHQGERCVDVHTRVRTQTRLCMFKCFCSMQNGRSYSSAVQVYTWAERTCTSHRRSRVYCCCCKYAPFCNSPAFPLHPPTTRQTPNVSRRTLIIIVLLPPALVPYCSPLGFRRATGYGVALLFQLLRALNQESTL